MMALHLLICATLLCFSSPASSTVHIHEHYKSSDAVKTGDDNTIVQLHVLFRHGERTPNSPQSESYPKDPYINATYYPVGWGQLTNVGKRTEYRIGETLRQRYDSFLGDLVFPPSMLEARSTDYNRTKASLELVLASLYPPRSLQNWKFNLDWQPIPYNYYPTHHDKELFGIYCPQYLKDYDDLINSQRMQQELAKYKDTFQYIQENSGKNITIFEDVYDMGFGFSAEELWGFKLPKWTEKIWPDVVMNISIKQYYVYMGTPDLRKMASGYHMKKILHDIDGIVNNTKDQAKIHLYSAHENNIGQLLIYMGVFDNTFPDYGSFVTIEVHKLNNQYSIRVLYDNRSESGSPKVLKVCGTDICSLEKFKSKFENYLPDDSLCGA